MEVNGIGNASLSVQKPIRQVEKDITSQQTEQKQEDKDKTVAYSPDKKKEMLMDAVEEANYKLEMSNRRCEFRYVEEANRVAIKVIDNDTDEVIREIPSEEALKTIEALREMTGVLIDHQL